MKHTLMIQLFSCLLIGQSFSAHAAQTDPSKPAPAAQPLPKTVTSFPTIPDEEEQEEGMLPISLFWQPGLNFIWSREGDKLPHTALGSNNFMRFALIYDLPFRKNSRFSAGFGLGYTPQTFQFSDGKCIGLAASGDTAAFALQDAKNLAPCPACQQVGDGCPHRSSTGGDDSDSENQEKKWDVAHASLTAHYMEAMAEIKFRKNPAYKEGFAAALGLKAGMLLSPNTTINFPHKGQDDEIQQIHFKTTGMKFGLSNYRVGAYTRMSWGRIGAWYEVMFTPFFNEKHTQNLAKKYTMSGGLSIDLF